jgi:membrane protein implicated in regulation of membrane protease activity
MDASLATWLWAAAGTALLLSELVVPGLVTGFLGLGALTVAGARWLGLVESLTASLVLWAVASGAYTLALRQWLLRRFGQGTLSRGSTSEEARAYGVLVDVVEDIPGEERAGRVRFDGTTWPAVSSGGPIARGTRARLLVRDNLAWVVEPAEEAPAAAPTDATDTLPRARQG